MLYIKYGAFLLLTIASGYLSANMFFELAGQQLLSQILLVVVGLSLESVKVFSLLRIEFLLFKGVQLFKGPASGQLRSSVALYGALALLSLTASFGFILVTVDQQVQVSRVDFVTSTEDIDFQIDQLEESLNFITPQIQTLQEQQAQLDPTWVTASQRLSESADELQAARIELISQISELRAERSRRTRETNSSRGTNVYGMFYLLGEPFGLRETQVMYILLALASILIEAGMIFTSPTINIPDEHQHEVSSKTRKKPGPKPGFKRKPKPKPTEDPVKKVPEKKPPPPLKKEEVSVVPVENTSLTVTVEPPEVKTSAKRETPKPTERKTYSDLVLIKQGNQLKSPSEVAYVTGVSVDKILKLYQRLSKMKGGQGIPLIEENNEGNWVINYDRSYIVSQLEKRK